MAEITEVAEKIYQIDNRLYGIPHWGSVYLLDEDRKALIDTGPSTSVPAVLEGVRQLGMKPEAIECLIVTHIHLDHAGGAGTLLKEMPAAKVWVHQRGAKHLVNPEKLIQSSLEARAKALEWNGEMLPVPEDRIQSVADGDELRLSAGQVLDFMDTPGHAPHELSIMERRGRSVFTGDGAGLHVDGGKSLLPSTPPPSFDMEKYRATLRRLLDLSASRICYAHFGTNTRVQENIGAVMDILRRWEEAVETAIREKSTDNLPERLLAMKLPELEAVKDQPGLYDRTANVSLPSSVRGFLKYFRDRNVLN